MNWRVYTVRVVLVLFDFVFLGFFFYLILWISLNVSKALVLLLLVLVWWFFFPPLLPSKGGFIYSWHLREPQSWKMYHLLGTVAAGAALRDGSAAIEPFCSALSKQHIFLVCARLVLVPCILPHGLTLHVLFSSCSATACVCWCCQLAALGPFLPLHGCAEVPAGAAHAGSCSQELGLGVESQPGRGSLENRAGRAKIALFSLVERLKCQLGTL